jgi:hypothetical protein
MTDDSYPEKTSSGIQTGSYFEQILQSYGQPDRNIELSKGRYLVYFNENLIFMLNEKGNVQSWGIFRIKEKNG